ncbi:MAG: hypothetical protein IKZ02_04200, partial [Alphaproteobacteria bacterium]|nr:hypothetical protein [Alphaproteobacteria bacterium]
LVVNGTLTVNSGITLKAKSISAISTTANGINNSGVITVMGNIYAKGKSVAIKNDAGAKLSGVNIEAITLGNSSLSCSTFSASNCNVVFYDAGNTTVLNNIILTQPTISQVYGYWNSENSELKGKNMIVLNCQSSQYAYASNGIVNLSGSLMTSGGAIMIENQFSADYIKAEHLSSISGKISANRVNVNKLAFYGTMTSNMVYGGTIQLYASIIGSGTITSPKIYYCSSYTQGNYSTTPIKKCAETCTAETPIWNGESCEACPSVRPKWNTEYGICETCETGTYWSGTSCVTECPNDKPLAENAVCRACPVENPYWDGTACVSNCPTEKPYLEDGTTCVTECSSGKRDDNMCVESCPTERPYLDNGVCVTSCPAERSEIGTNNTCITTEQWCVNQMEISGFMGDDYTVSGNTITYAGDMTVAQDLNISKCDLTVNGTLIVNEGVVLNGHDMNAIGVTGNGITLYGMMNVNNITATSTADATYGVRVMSAGNLTATDIIASGKKYGFYSKGIVSATNITGSGEARGVYLKSTVPLVIKEEIVGISETSAGVSIAGPETVVTAKNVVGTSTSGYGIAIDGKLIVTGTAKGTSVSSVGIRIYYGTVTSDSVTTVYEGTLIATGDVTGISTDNNGIYCGYKLETEGNIFAKSESSYALTVLGTVKAKDIYYCKKYYIYDEASIVGTLKCNSGCTCTN